MSKTINKEKLDAAIYVARHYYDHATPCSNDEARVFFFLCREVDDGFLVSPTSDLLAAIFNGGYKPDATNEDVYKVLEVLGWRVE